MLFLNEREVTSLLPIGDVLTALESAFRAQAAGQIRMPLRTMASTGDGLLGAMPAAIAGESAALGAKLVTFFPGNAAAGVHTHQALVALFDPHSGQPQAIMDGRFITEIRTAATSALATRALARPDARVVAILGTGVQARAHIGALSEVMHIDELRVWGRTRAKATALADCTRASRTLQRMPARERGLYAPVRRREIRSSRHLISNLSRMSTQSEWVVQPHESCRASSWGGQPSSSIRSTERTARAPTSSWRCVRASYPRKRH